jgi:hypothetical protein
MRSVYPLHANLGLRRAWVKKPDWWLATGQGQDRGRGLS